MEVDIVDVVVVDVLVEDEDDVNVEEDVVVVDVLVEDDRSMLIS